MVTVNLLPWRPLSQHYRMKILRRIILWVSVLLMIATCLCAAFFLRSRPAVSTASTLPQPLSTDTTSDTANKAWQLQQMMRSLLHSLDCAPHPGLYLTQLTLLPASAGLRGRADSVSAWLSFISSLQQIWMVQVTDLQHPTPQGQSFSLTLTPMALPGASPDNGTISEINNHTVAVQKMLSVLPHNITAETLHIADSDNQPSALQVAGTFPTLAHIASSLHGSRFFCAADSIKFVRSSTAVRLIFKWHFPCFESSLISEGYISRTDPFSRTPFPFIAETSSSCAD